MRDERSLTLKKNVCDEWPTSQSICPSDVSRKLCSLDSISLGFKMRSNCTWVLLEPFKKLNAISECERETKQSCVYGWNKIIK